MKTLIILVACFLIVGCSSTATLTCSDNAPACLSSPLCVGQVEGTACGSWGGMCTDIGRDDDPLFQPCCSCNNTVRIELEYTEDTRVEVER